MAPLRIAAHISAAEWGGAERRSLALLSGLAARGHAIVVYCNTPRIAEKARDAGLTPVISPLHGDVMLGNALTFARHLRRQKPDVLLLITFRRLLLGGLAGRMARVPRIIARIGLGSDVARSTKYRFVLRRWIDDVVVNAESMRQPFIASLTNPADVRMHVIPNGVAPRDASALTRAEARAAIGVPEDAYVVGSVARLVKQKRFDRLLHAAAVLEDAHVVIAGDGYQRELLEQLAVTLGIEQRVHLLGHREDAGTLHRALDVYVVCSEQEGMSSGMLEAMAAGLPIVSTDVSGAREALLGTPSCGIVVEHDPSAIADAVRRLESDARMRDEYGRAATAIAAERYGFDGMVEQWNALLTGG